MFFAFKNNHHNNLLFALVSGMLLGLSWPPIAYPVFIFVALVPLLVAVVNALNQGLTFVKVLTYPIIAFGVFNLITTWWVGNASVFGAVVAVMLNTTLMSLPFVFFIKQFNKTKRLGWFMLVCMWLAMEWLHTNWDLHWPWLTIGNVFANQTWLVQWYEYTGVMGGSVWVWWFNIGLAKIMLNYKELTKPVIYKQVFNLLFFRWFALVLFSIYVGYEYNNSLSTTKRLSSTLVVVQPNIDPYQDKFNGLNPYEQTKILLALADSVIDENVQCLVFPETALVGGLNENNLHTEEPVKLIQVFQQKHPQLAVVTGAETFKTFLPNEPLSETAREYNPGQFYDAYNTALYINANDTAIGIYHKSKLVPGVEQLPFAKVLKPLSALTVNLGGTTGSLGKSLEPEIFALNSVLKIAPIICYESVFGEYVGKYVTKGASLLCIVTNDGWWGNTAGYKQHLAYARLRAIETRRYVVRSANTGISAFIDDNGKILQQTNWWQPAVIKQTVHLNQQKTFYTKHGDWIGEIAVAISLFFLAGFFLKRNQRFSH